MVETTKNVTNEVTYQYFKPKALERNIRALDEAFLHKLETKEHAKVLDWQQRFLAGQGIVGVVTKYHGVPGVCVRTSYGVHCPVDVIQHIVYIVGAYLSTRWFEFVIWLQKKKPIVFSDIGLHAANCDIYLNSIEERLNSTDKRTLKNERLLQAGSTTRTMVVLTAHWIRV